MRKIFPSVGMFVVWAIMPYAIALGLLALNKRLAESPNRAKAALHMGRLITDATKRSIKNE